MKNLLENKEYFDDNFFVITSDNLKDVKPRIYGYAFLEDSIVINTECNYSFLGDTYGCYVNILKDDEKIEIFQDYFGSYGLYLYNKDGYFAIGNSFLYLVNYLKFRKKITFDLEYAKGFLSAPTASFAFSDTMIQEIKLLPKNCSVYIDLKSSSIKINSFDQKESYINVDTKYAVDIIDAWHKRWNLIFKTLIDKDKYVICDLSGGKDSRVSLSCLLHPRLNLDRVFFNSAEDKLHTHQDDFEIATKISNKFNFSLNKGNREKRYKMDPLVNLNASYMIKCGFHREIMVTNFWREETIFRITGSGGGDLRDFWGQSAESFIEEQCKNTSYNTVDFRDALRSMMIKTKDQIDNYIGNTENYTARDYFYKHCRQRHHHAKANVELFLSNVIVLAPLMDPVLYKLNQNIGRDNDNDLIYAIIYGRYLSEISDVGFDSNRIVKNETKNVASEINKKFPRKESNQSGFKPLEIFSRRLSPSKSTNMFNALDCLKDSFYTEDLKKFVYDEFGEEVYNRADAYYNRKYHPYIAASGLVQAYIIHEAARLSNEINCWSIINVPHDRILRNNNSKSYINVGFLKHVLDFLQSARFELKVLGNESNRVVVNNCDDDSLYLEYPKWFSDKNGKGLILQSSKCDIKFDFRSNGSGDLLINLKGPWMKDAGNNPMRIKIDFIKFVLKDKKTNEIIIDEDNIYSIDSSNVKSYKVPCLREQEFSLEAKWFPYVYNEDDFHNLLHEMLRKSNSEYLFWKKSR